MYLGSTFLPRPWQGALGSACPGAALDYGQEGVNWANSLLGQEEIGVQDGRCSPTRGPVFPLTVLVGDINTQIEREK